VLTSNERKATSSPVKPMLLTMKLLVGID